MTLMENTKSTFFRKNELNRPQFNQTSVNFNDDVTTGSVNLHNQSTDIEVLRKNLEQHLPKQNERLPHIDGVKTTGGPEGGVGTTTTLLDSSSNIHLFMPKEDSNMIKRQPLDLDEHSKSQENASRESSVEHYQASMDLTHDRSYIIENDDLKHRQPSLHIAPIFKSKIRDS